MHEAEREQEILGFLNQSGFISSGIWNGGWMRRQLRFGAISRA
jgi:hypothetical protein